MAECGWGVGGRDSQGHRHDGHSVCVRRRRLRDEEPRGRSEGSVGLLPASSASTTAIDPRTLTPWHSAPAMRTQRGCVLLLSAALASLYFLNPPATPPVHHASPSNSSNATRPRSPPPSDLLRTKSIFKCRPLAYRHPPNPPVALASFPGSGNTWLRYLLQLSTGIFTGSVYKDFALLRNGFPGESVTGGSVLVVKTHESGPAARAPFAKAILLIRKPSEAILAEFNRRAAGHIGHAGRDKYTRNAGRYWASFVAQKGKSWTETNLDWIEGFEGPLAITQYTSLVKNTSGELGSLLAFLEESVEEEVARCVERNKEGIYRRRKKGLPFNPFTPKMERFLAAQERIVAGAIARRLSYA